MTNIENRKQATDTEEIRDFLYSIAASLEDIAGSLQTIAQAVGETYDGQGFIRTIDIAREG